MNATDTVRSLLWRPTSDVATLAARPTARWRPLPDFIIVGAQRCGTTSLFRYLVQHPAVAGPRFTKGVHWFDTEFARSEAWYRSQFPTRRRRERMSRRAGTAAIAGEASPYYLFHPFVPARMAAHLPETRFVALLRDPVERLRSHHRHEVARGFETLSLEAALDAEEERLEGADEVLAKPGGVHFSHQHHAYAARGRYAEQLERLWSAVGRDRVLVVFTEDLDRDTVGTVHVVQRFLGLPPHDVESDRRWNVRQKPPIAGPLEARLRRYYHPHDERLAQLLGREPPWSLVGGLRA